MKLSVAFKGCLVTSAVLFASLASALDTPKGAVILTVSGNITETNSANGAEFDREMLLALGNHTLKTDTPWTEGMNTFNGPLLSEVLNAVGAKGENLVFTALNDYSANLPAQDAFDHNVMLAMDMNGKKMSVRDKGPIFVLYPFADKPELNNEVIHNRSVWQVKTIKVE